MNKKIKGVKENLHCGRCGEHIKGKDWEKKLKAHKCKWWKKFFYNEQYTESDIFSAMIVFIISSYFVNNLLYKIILWLIFWSSLEVIRLRIKRWMEK